MDPSLLSAYGADPGLSGRSVNDPLQVEKQTWTTLLAYGALGLPLAALNLPLYVYLPAFYAGDIGLGLAVVGYILFFARLLDTITDPLIGLLSDRFETRFGRRRPWVVAACPLLIIASFMLFVPDQQAGAAYLFVWTSLAYLAWTMMILPFTAWGAELSSDYHERSKITGTREAFVVIGILLAAAIPTLFGLNAETEQGQILKIVAWSMSLLLPIALIALLLLVPEPRVAVVAAKPLSIKAGLRLAWRNRPFLRLVSAFFLNGIANGLPATLFLLFVGDVLKAGGLAGPLLLLYFVAGIIGIPIWLKISTFVGKHRAWAMAMLWASLMFSMVPFLGAGDVMPFVIICCLSGLSLGADMALPASIQADVVDLDWLESGQQRTGLFFAVWSMATKLSLALAVVIAFPFLEMIGFSAGGENSDRALFGLAALYGLLPVIIKVLATCLIWNFPIGAAEQIEIQAKIVKRRAAEDPLVVDH